MGCCKDAIHYAKGAAKVAQSIAGIGIADAATIEARRAICRACEHAMPCKHNVARKCTCNLCGCRLAHKTRLAREKCPEGKW